LAGWIWSSVVFEERFAKNTSLCPGAKGSPPEWRIESINGANDRGERLILFFRNISIIMNDDAMSKKAS
jgi:hypothetical protein